MKSHDTPYWALPLVGLSTLLSGCAPTPSFPGEAQLKEIAAYMIAFGEVQRQNGDEVRYCEPWKLRKVTENIPPGHGVNLVEYFQSLQFELSEDRKHFVAYLTPTHKFPGLPFGALASFPAYRVDESGKIRMIRVKQSGARCPEHAPVVAKISEQEIAEVMKTFSDTAELNAVDNGATTYAGPAANRVPDYMPILNDKMAAGEYRPWYNEPEITNPILLCDADGNLRPDAVGWARHPIIRANLKGHWPRKKRWVFWNWISPDFVFSVTVADIDLACFCAASLIDFETGEAIERFALRPSGFVKMPEEVEQSIAFKGGAIDYTMTNEGGDIDVRFACENMSRHKVTAAFTIHKPENHETLNIIVPWSNTRFQCNSKHNTLPVEGSVVVDGGKTYVMDPETCHGVQDWGRGMWPFRSCWNWAVCSGKQGDDLIGVNMGSKWTTGTGANENAICFNGRLHKIMEDVVWEYDPTDWMKPWRLYTAHSDRVDLVLTPRFANTAGLNLGIIGSKGTCSFGNWTGTLKFADQVVEVKELPGWAEEFEHRW